MLLYHLLNKYKKLLIEEYKYQLFNKKLLKFHKLLIKLLLKEYKYQELFKFKKLFKNSLHKLN
jgi:hypothetical protein